MNQISTHIFERPNALWKKIYIYLSDPWPVLGHRSRSSILPHNLRKLESTSRRLIDRHIQRDYFFLRARAELKLVSTNDIVSFLFKFISLSDFFFFTITYYHGLYMCLYVCVCFCLGLRLNEGEIGFLTSDSGISGLICVALSFFTYYVSSIQVQLCFFFQLVCLKQNYAHQCRPIIRVEYYFLIPHTKAIIQAQTLNFFSFLF